MSEVVLISLPKQDLNNPPAALAILSAVAMKNNYDVQILDLNQILNSKLTKQEWDKFDKKSILGNDDLKLEPSLKNSVTQIFSDALQNVISENTKFIAVSVFTFESLIAANLLLDILQSYDVEIIIGGTGCESLVNGLEWYKSVENIVNYIVLGDGEVGFEKILQNVANKIEKNSGDINDYPIPDYTKFNKSFYIWNKIYITGSRGCVRDCSFCDVARYWPQFRYRKAEFLVDEIKKQVDDIGVKHFEFTDSLINGSVSNFYDFNLRMAELKRQEPYTDITYSGQFICRPSNQMPPQHYEAMHYGGCKQVIVGIESFSESVRNHIKKKFSNADIDYHLEQCAFWGIPNVFLMIVGYPSETDSDHLENLRTLEKYQKYVYSNTIFMISFGYTMHLLHATPLLQNHPELDITVPDANSAIIFDWSNENSNLKKRISRRIELHEIAYDLGYKQPRSHTYLEFLKDLSETLK